MAKAYEIRPDDLTGQAVAELLGLHLAEMHASSPACKVNALPLERLRAPDVAFFGAWHDGQLAAVGALKELDATRGELKSMRAAPDYRGQGAGEAILRHLISEAERRGYLWLGLETGRTEAFAPAHGLYRKYGFAECPAFADYVTDEFSLCMDKAL